ncbi:hypothetical protein H6F38_04640 [Paenibacillus sp. EKM208P]|nr:hypothetical protein H6F38_04640 [Paenibacillus sp. EKM208P]
MTETKKNLPKKEAEEVQKSCFIVMPISDAEGYEKGHFSRVYEHIIKPACELAGFEPIRADDVKHTNAIILDIIKKIIEADMVVCDLSSRNPNVLYELGIRHAFNLPVVLIKDTITPRPFDISALRDVPYDPSLRIDTVSIAINAVSEALKETFEQKGKDTNSLVELLGVQSAKLPEPKTISGETSILLNAIDDLKLSLQESKNKPNWNTWNEAYKNLPNSEKLKLSEQFQPGVLIENNRFGVCQVSNFSMNTGTIRATQLGSDRAVRINYPYTDTFIIDSNESLIGSNN